jgi:hypothetical protein
MDPPLQERRKPREARRAPCVRRRARQERFAVHKYELRELGIPDVLCPVATVIAREGLKDRTWTGRRPCPRD